MKQLKIGDRVLLRETEWTGAQKATVIGIDREVVTYDVDPEDRLALDREGLVEGPATDVIRHLS